MIIELCMVQEDGNEILQTYVFDKERPRLAKINIPSYIYACQAIRLLRFASYILNVSIPNSNVPVVTQEEYDNDYKPYLGSYIAIMYKKSRIELRSYNDSISVTINHNRVIHCNLAGLVTMDNVQFSLYGILCMKNVIDVVHEFNTVAYLDEMFNATNGINAIYAVPELANKMKEYVKKYYSIDIDVMISRSGINSVINIIMEGFFAVGNVIIFTDMYKNFDDMIKNENIPEDRANEFDDEYRDFMNDMNYIIELVQNSIGKTPSAVLVNADPINDKYYEKSDYQDKIHLSLENLDPTILSDLRDKIEGTIDEFLSGRLNSGDSINGIHVYGGYIDDDGNIHILKPGEDNELNDVILDKENNNSLGIDMCISDIHGDISNLGTLFSIPDDFDDESDNSDENEDID